MSGFLNLRPLPRRCGAPALLCRACLRRLVAFAVRVPGGWRCRRCAVARAVELGTPAILTAARLRAELRRVRNEQQNAARRGATA